MTIIEELIKPTAADFTEHLNLPGNERILFSGKFGKGKTTFLKTYFSRQDKYDVVFLDPVNYTVASNEDIFRYIKYDILLHLLEQNTNLEGVTFTKGEVASYYLANHPVEVIKGLLKYIPKVGMLLDEAVKGLDALHQKVKDFQNQIEERSEDTIALNFLNSIQNEPYSIYENDIITKIIRQLLRPEGKLKKNILVIDNLDRIDPEHIFRILNVFSTQMDYNVDRISINKFFFDKVVVVCDIENVRNIYRNKYGIDVDFSGYIDKFYSNEIFYLQNYSQLRKVCQKELRKLDVIVDGFKARKLNDLGNDFGIFYLVTSLVYQNRLSLRRLVNYCAGSINFEDMEFSGGISPVQTPLVEMRILANIMGGYHVLMQAIEYLIMCNAQTSDFLIHFTKLLHYDMRNVQDLFHGAPPVYKKINGKEFQVVFHFENERPTKVFLNEQAVQRNWIQYEVTSTDYYRLYLSVLKEFYVQKLIE